jgi:hypothetical protein
MNVASHAKDISIIAIILNPIAIKVNLISTKEIGIIIHMERMKAYNKKLLNSIELLRLIDF